jgi:diguanylate cyclase (GGDEF)-like protein
MRNISEAWEAWWIDERGDTIFLGGSGKIGTSAEAVDIRDQTYILQLPNNSNQGILVVYLSAFHFDRGGLYGSLEISEFTTVLRQIMIDLASRSFLVGIGLYVVIQNLVFYFRRRQDKTLLLLSIFGLAGILRSSFASGYVDSFVTLPSFTFVALKIEYMLVIWPVVAALHYLTALFPCKEGKPLLKLSYVLFAIMGIVTIVISVAEMTYHLVYYQITLLLITAACLWIIGNEIRLKNRESIFFLRSFIPLVIAVINDIVAAKSAGYNFYIAEYALFLFLFLQTQIQATKFVIALDTAEHLTANLQQEVELKTEQLSKHNQLLKEKAQNLEAKHFEVKLLSETDHLTGLFNRHTLENHSKMLFQLAQNYNQALSVVMMDLDHFKQVNDEYGHHVGDECLVFVASFLRGLNLRKRDIIARYGGEELIILLTDTALEPAMEIVESMCNGLKQFPVEGDHPDIYLTASFGVADIATSEAKTIEQLIQHADAALYLAKQNGRDRVEAFQKV